MGKIKRKLTKAELIRKEQYERKIIEAESQGYRKKELTMNIVAANILAVIIMIPLVAMFAGGYIYLNKSGISISIRLSYLWIYSISIFVLLVVHEGIHGFILGVFSKNHFQDIEFGVIWEMLTPYCTTKSELSKNQFLLGAVMPTILLGIIPACFALAFNSLLLLLVALTMLIGGGGDFLICLKLFNYRERYGETKYLDHPYELGVVVLEKEV